jgi:polysaccharide biosynthesis protein PslG
LEPLVRARGRSARVAAVVALLVFGAAPAQAARSEFFGITDAPRPADADLQGIASTGVHAYRFPLVWRSVESSQGSYDWGPTDQWVGALASRGIRTVPFLWGSPAWAATGGLQRPPVSASDRRAWTAFLEAAVARYGPAGSYWTSDYRQQFGIEPRPWPITSWEIWNEPNLKFFYPGGTIKRKAQRYGRLLQISETAIKAEDPHARIVLAGMAPRTGKATVDGSTFLSQLYKQVPGFREHFDFAALHPYSPDLNQVRQQIVNFRAALKRHGDQAKPLWITELGWGSANLGLATQAQLLTDGYRLILNHRRAWKVERLFWYRWRDPSPEPELKCHLCLSAGLLTYDGLAKPVLDALVGFAGDTTPPRVTITSGPGSNRLTHDSTPTFRFKSNEPGSTFACRFDDKPLASCSPPHTARTRLATGSHVFGVRAIDAAGNEGAVKSRSFRVG